MMKFEISKFNLKFPVTNVIVFYCLKRDPNLVKTRKRYTIDTFKRHSLKTNKTYHHQPKL